MLDNVRARIGNHPQFVVYVWLYSPARDDLQYSRMVYTWDGL
jgi:hypothetical protein